MGQPINVGITGSRHGWTQHQRTEFVRFLHETPIKEFHFGACVGVDEEAFWLWVTEGSGVGHAWPATMNPKWDEQWRMKSLTPEVARDVGVAIHEPCHPLHRNRLIVANCDELWAFPQDDSGKGGTWATINFAREARKDVTVTYPKDSDASGRTGRAGA